MIKPADKSSCMVVWDKTDYLLEVKKHLSESNTYKEVKFGNIELVKLMKHSNRMFKKRKELDSVPQYALLVTADVVGLYPSIPHQDMLEALSIKLNQREDNEFVRSIYGSVSSLKQVFRRF